MADQATSQATTQDSPIQLEGGTYEIIRNRLLGHGATLRERLGKLNEARKDVFGAIEYALLSTDRISTDNNCVARDIVAIGNRTLFGYNVQMGLRSEVKLSDVFSVYRYEDRRFHGDSLDFMADPRFEEDFKNLYKYYRETVFVRFLVQGLHLHLIFRIGKSEKDVKSFKWLIQPDHSLVYLDARSEAEIKQPTQHEFRWVRAHRDMHRKGRHPHISVLDRIFVETIGGTLTIKVEDNTDTGRGIYEEEVFHKEQGLDDAEIFFADLGNIILLKIKPFQEKDYRYIAFNEKVQEAKRIDAAGHACVLLPDDHGIIFPNGYYLQTGAFKQYDTVPADLQFERRLLSPNGEDFLYVFHNFSTGVYLLLSYNLISQQVETPIFCHGYCTFDNGELCYFRAEEEPRKHHAIQIWQTPYTGADYRMAAAEDNYLFKLGNKDIVHAMADCHEVLTLLNKDDSYGNLYLDLVKRSSDILDTYFWLDKKEAFEVQAPVREIKTSAQSAIDEFDKVQRVRKHTREESQRVGGKVEALLKTARLTIFEDVNQYVRLLADLRVARGETISLKSLRYIDLAHVEDLEKQLGEETARLSEGCVQFLLRDDALTPYQARVAELAAETDKSQTAAQATEVEERIAALGADLELLIEIVSNLKIADATLSTKIIDRISAIYAELNQVRAALRRRRKELAGAEAVGAFAAQLKLVAQAVTNYLDVSDSPAKCEEYLTKVMVQVEELEGKFAEYDEFTTQLADKREEVYNAFESRKLQLIEARNKRATSLFKSAERILSGIRNRAAQFGTASEINGYFAGDQMIDKVRDIVRELQEMDDTVKSEDLQSKLKTIREDALRQLRDKQDLFVEGENTIRLGKHAFSVNVQPLDLTIVARDGQQFAHLTGTNFFERIEDAGLEATRPVWEQALVSEDSQVYRAEYLAYQFMQDLLARPEKSACADFLALDPSAQLAVLHAFMGPRYQDGYAKGVHDLDALRLLRGLLQLHGQIALLRYLPEHRACAILWWARFADAASKQHLENRIKGLGQILKAFPDTREYARVVAAIAGQLGDFVTATGLFPAGVAESAAAYLFHELANGDTFVFSPEGHALSQDLKAYLAKQQMQKGFQESLDRLQDSPADAFDLLRAWVRAFVAQTQRPDGQDYVDEAAVLLFVEGQVGSKVAHTSVHTDVEALAGDHSVIGEKGHYTLDYNHFMHKLAAYQGQVVPMFLQLGAVKKALSERYRHALRLDEFQPKVLSSFVRNKLIDEVYLPLFGDNLAKQIGAVGDTKRTDRQGMLLLISPPGYGKTTLMEYIASRLGLIFVKVNGPAIGHGVTSIDPATAPNAAAREELNKLNLALEMGDNIMLYVDDIQHCNPEFLQKFISLCDAQRKIEGVYQGRAKTYDLRGKRVCVVMAGNPYTESGEKFQVPDMLANRADTYNLGDIIGNTEQAFRLSLIENCLTSNPALQKVAQRSHKDIHAFLHMAEADSREGVDLEGNYTPEDVNEIVAVLKKLIQVRDVVLKVNQAYIASAGMAAEYRTEPPFRLQGSYRDMNKLCEKIFPIMNAEELKTLLLTHYENESQTLTTGAESNLLKFKELAGWLDTTEQARWDDIKATFMKRQRLLGIDASDKFGQVIVQLGSLVDGIEGLKKAVEKG